MTARVYGKTKGSAWPPVVLVRSSNSMKKLGMCPYWLKTRKLTLMPTRKLTMRLIPSIDQMKNRKSQIGVVLVDC